MSGNFLPIPTSATNATNATVDIILLYCSARRNSSNICSIQEPRNSNPNVDFWPLSAGHARVHAIRNEIMDLHLMVEDEACKSSENH
jgi:hypothetical protein